MINDIPLDETGISFGISLPLGGFYSANNVSGFSNFNIGIELGERGVNEAGLYANVFGQFARAVVKRFMVYKKTIQLIKKMKKYVSFIVASLILVTGQMFAQDNQECLQNLSIFAENAKVKNYAAAYEPWLAVKTVRH